MKNKGRTSAPGQEVSLLKSDPFGDKVSLYNGATEFDGTDIACRKTVNSRFGTVVV